MAVNQDNTKVLSDGQLGENNELQLIMEKKDRLQKASELEIKAIDSMNVAELKESLKKLRLSTEGKKAALQKRLKQYEEERAMEKAEESALEENEEELDETIVKYQGQGNNTDTDEESDSGNSVSDTDDERAAVSVRSGNNRQTIRNGCERSRNAQSRARQVYSSDRFTIRDVEESMSHFSGDDKLEITKWLAEFQDMSELLEWDCLQKLIYAKRLLRGSAKQFISFQRDIKSWSVLKRRLKQEFKTKISSAALHNQLLLRRRRPGESARCYMYAMQEIASQGNIDTDSLIEYIIKGVPDDEMNKAILYGANTLSQLKEAFEKYDKMKEFANKKVKHFGKDIIREWKIVRSESSKRIRCFNCGSVEHELKHCLNKDKGPKCFACNEFGHRASSCIKVKANISETTKVNRVVSSEDKTVAVKINGKYLFALVDTGSDVNVMRQDKYEQIGRPKLQRTTRLFTGFGNATTKPFGVFNTDIVVDDDRFRTNVFVVPSACMEADVILGQDLLKDVKVVIQRGQIQIQPLPPIRTEGDTAKDNRNGCDRSQQTINTEENTEKENDEGKSEVDELLLISDSIVSDIDVYEPYKCEVKKLIDDYKPKKDVETWVETKIVLNDSEPVRLRPRRLAPKEKQILDKQIREWLDEGIVRPSNSEYASPAAIIPKKNGTYRVCIDFRELNKKIVKDRFPMPLVEDKLDELACAKLFSLIDLKNGFFHVPIEKNSSKLTAFVTPDGQYEFLRTPFGLCNSPASFLRFVHEVFNDLMKRKVVVAYMDDIIIPGIDGKDALAKLKETLEVAADNGLIINWHKSKLLQKRIEFLGQEIENGNIRPSESKIKAVKYYPKPESLKQVQSFLGLTGYFRKFIEDYARIARPLSDLLKKDNKFRFDREQVEAFNRLKVALVKAPVLRIYSSEMLTELHTDASKEGYGAVLLQKGREDSDFHPVHYFSRKTSESEKNYHSFELEILAVIRAVQKFRIYLLGVKFKLVTDCEAFKKTLFKKDLTPKIARWALALEEFSYDVEHRPGVRLKHVDALSRSPVMIIEDKVLFAIRKAQENEERLKVIKQLLEKEPYENYALKDGLLMRQSGGKLLIVLPARMQTDVIRQAHDKGHFGVKKMSEEISNEYYIPNLDDKLKEYIKCCVPCILTEKKRGKKEGALMPIPKGDVPLDTFHIDHLGPMTATNKVYKYIFVVVDGFSKFVWLYPTKTTATKEVINKLLSQQQIFGNPRRIICDRGTAFTSNDFREYCVTEGIELIFTTTGVPRGNGQVERVNRIIIPVLSKLAIDHPAQWYKYVNRVQKCINSSYQRSIKMTPFELIFGVKMKQREDLDVLSVIDEEVVQVFNEERLELREVAKQNIAKIQEENRRDHNKKCKEARIYKEGDLVVIKRTQFGPGLKIKKKFLGPYKVSRVKRNNRYEVIRIGNDEGPKITSTVVDYMKPYDESSSGTEDRSGTAECGVVE